MNKQSRKPVTEAGVVKGNRLHYWKGEKRNHRSQQELVSSSAYAFPSSHSCTLHSSLGCSSRHPWDVADSGNGIEFPVHSNRPPVFGPSLTPSYHLFVDVTTNIGYMNPFDMPSYESSSEIITPPLTCNGMPSSASLSAKTSPHITPVFLPHAALPRASFSPSASPETPLNTPAAAGRCLSQDRPQSPSPIPCPPEKGIIVNGKWVSPGKIDSWSEPSVIPFSVSSLGCCSLSKSFSGSAEPSTHNDCLSSHVTVVGMTEAHKKRKSSTYPPGQTSLANNGKDVECTRGSTCTTGNQASVVLEAAEKPGDQVALIPDVSPKLSCSTCGPLDDTGSSTKQPSVSNSIPFPPPSSAKVGQFNVVVEGHFGRTFKLFSTIFVEHGTHVTFEGDRGTDMGCVIHCEPTEEPMENRTKAKGKDAVPKVIEVASEKSVEEWKVQQPMEAQRSLAACQALVDEKKCQLNIVGAAYQYDMIKLTFFYRSEEQRVDFRSLLPILYSSFHCRIWMERVEDDISNETSSK